MTASFPDLFLGRENGFIPAAEYFIPPRPTKYPHGAVTVMYPMRRIVRAALNPSRPLRYDPTAAHRAMHSILLLFALSILPDL